MKSNEPLRIVDAVLGRQVGRASSRRIVAFFAAIVLYIGAALIVAWWDPSLEGWAAELAAHVHSELDRSQPVAIEMPPVPPPTPPTPPPAPPPATTPTPRTPSRATPSRAPAPAQAANVVAADPGAPADFSGKTIVTGAAKSFAGGQTATAGTNEKAVPPGPLASGEAKAQAVRLRDGEWSCRWPSEADALDLDEQTVVLKVHVGADGNVRDVRNLDDPGHGFAAAARQCAQRTAFEPALDGSGNPIDAWSPAIRVHFTRQ